MSRAELLYLMISKVLTLLVDKKKVKLNSEGFITTYIVECPEVKVIPVGKLSLKYSMMAAQ